MSLQKYSVVFENESQRRDRSGRPWVGWTGLSTGRGRKRSGALSRAEKAGLLGMVAVVVIILSVVVTSGDRTDGTALSASSEGYKVREALNAGNGIDNVEPVQRPGAGSKVVNTIFGGGEVKEEPVLKLGDPNEARKVKPTPKPTKPKFRPYKIRKGDTLGHIARRMLGKTRRWTEIRDLNPKLNPKNLKPGTTIKIPPK